jgi:hypothetical protein
MATTKKRTKAAESAAEGEKLARVVLEIPEPRKRALKVKAATEGLTIKDYVLKLLSDAGV